MSNLMKTNKLILNIDKTIYRIFGTNTTMTLSWTCTTESNKLRCFTQRNTIVLNSPGYKSKNPLFIYPIGPSHINYRLIGDAWNNNGLIRYTANAWHGEACHACVVCTRKDSGRYTGTGLTCPDMKQFTL